MAPVLVWVYFWLVIPFVSALVGDVWQYINPWRTIGKVGQVGMRERPELLERFGVWPAVLGFGAFTWFELVWADPARPSVLGVAAVIYTLYLVLMMLWAGRESALHIGDAFTSYNSLIGALAPIGPRLRPTPGLARLATGATRYWRAAGDDRVRGGDDRNRQLRRTIEHNLVA